MHGVDEGALPFFEGAARALADGDDDGFGLWFEGEGFEAVGLTSDEGDSEAGFDAHAEAGDAVELTGDFGADSVGGEVFGDLLPVVRVVVAGE